MAIVEFGDTPMEIYIRFVPPDCLPKDVPYDKLTPEQQQLWQDKYRFGGFIPGTYQGITGIQGSYG
jgi:hypothetical protein